MTHETFDRRLTEWLQREAEHRVPDHLDAVLVQTVATRQRHWWSSPERWLPMDVLAPTRSASIRPVFLLLLLAALIVATLGLVAVIGRPGPFPVDVAGNGRLYVADGPSLRSFDAAGGDARTVATLPDGADSLAVAPDGSRLAVVGADGPGLTVQPLEGGDPVAIWAPSGSRSVTSLRWSPDGRSLAFVAYDGAVEQLVIAPADGTPGRILELGTGGARGLWSIAWSPDGGRLAVIASEPGQETGRIHLIGVDGSGHRVLPTSRVAVNGGGDVAWSTALGGSQLIYVADASPLAIHRLDLETEEETDLGQGFWPSLSPDGRRLAYWTDGTVVVDLAEVTDGRTEPTYVFEAPAHTLAPRAPLPGRYRSCDNPDELFGNEICQPVAWSPDATSVFGPDINGGALIIAPIDGTTRPTLIPMESSGATPAAWQPLP